jgi:hypothetical protein
MTMTLMSPPAVAPEAVAPEAVPPEEPLEDALGEELQAASTSAKIAGSTSRHLRRMEAPGRPAISDSMMA